MVAYHKLYFTEKEKKKTVGTCMRLQRPHEYIRVDIFPVKRKWGKMVMTLILKVKKFKNKKPKKKKKIQTLRQIGNC